MGIGEGGGLIASTVFADPSGHTVNARAAAETMPQATTHADDLIGAIEEIRRMCAVAEGGLSFIDKAAVAEVLERWCV